MQAEVRAPPCERVRGLVNANSIAFGGDALLDGVRCGQPDVPARAHRRGFAADDGIYVLEGERFVRAPAGEEGQSIREVRAVAQRARDAYARFDDALIDAGYGNADCDSLRYFIDQARAALVELGISSDRAEARAAAPFGCPSRATNAPGATVR